MATVKIKYRDKEYEVNAGMTVRDAIKKCGLQPEAVLAVSNGKLVTDDTIIQPDMTLKLVAVVFGRFGMRCKKCGGSAVINMRQHKLALCTEHYLEWLPEQVERFIEKYKMFTRQEKVLMAVSGGKDSLGLWDILHRLGYHTEGLYIGLGIEQNYSDESRRLSEQFAAARGLTLHVVDVAARFGATIPELSVISNRGHNKPCSVCGLNKRYIMNRAALEGGFAALATGHNLDDEAAVLMQNTFNWAGGYLARQAPVLPSAEGLMRKVKPLCRIYEREMTAYCLVSGIDYIYEECPHAEGSTTIYYKEILNKMEEDRPGAKLQFYISFLQAKDEGLFTVVENKDKAELHPCDRCGQPTSAPGDCSFCRLWDKVALVKQTVRTSVSDPLLARV